MQEIVSTFEYRKLLQCLPVGEAAILNKREGERFFVDHYYDLYLKYHSKKYPLKAKNSFFDFLGDPYLEGSQSVNPFMSERSFFMEFTKHLYIEIVEFSSTSKADSDLVTSSRVHADNSFIEIQFYLAGEIQIKDGVKFCGFGQRFHRDLFHITLAKTNQKRGGSYLYETHSSNQMIPERGSSWCWEKAYFKSYQDLQDNHQLKYQAHSMRSSPQIDDLQSLTYGTGTYFYRMLFYIMSVFKFKLPTNQVSKMICSSCHRSPGAEKLWSRSKTLRKFANIIECPTLMRHKVKAEKLGIYCQPKYYLLDHHFPNRE